MRSFFRLRYLFIFILSILALVYLTYTVRSIKETLRSTKYLMDIENNRTKDEIVSLLLINDVFDQNGQIKLMRIGKQNDVGYMLPEKALSAADVLMSYGILDDNSFEEMFSDTYNKPSYGFDCGLVSFKGKNPLFKFVSECIGTDHTLLSGFHSSNNVTSFSNQIKKLELENKKIFIKMDIEGGEYYSFDDILLEHGNNITGIVLELYIDIDRDTTREALNLLNQLNKDFVLVYAHGNNCCPKLLFSSKNAIGKVPMVIELSYINKSLITKHQVANDQKHPQPNDSPNVLTHEDVKFEILK